MFSDCDDPLCSVHRDPADHFADWPPPFRPALGPLAELGEWVVGLVPVTAGAMAVTADGGIIEWSQGRVGWRSGDVDAPARLHRWREADGASVLAARASSGELAVAEPGRLSLYGAEGPHVNSLGLPGRPSALAWHPGGRFVVAAYGRTVVAVEPAGVEVARCDLLPSIVSAVVFDLPRARIGAVVKKGVVWFDDALEPVTFHAVLWDDGLRSAAFSPDWLWLAIGCYGGTTLLWGDEGGEANRSAAGPPGAGEVLAWSPDGRFLAVAHDRFVAIHPVVAASPRGSVAGGAGGHQGADPWEPPVEPVVIPDLRPAPASVPTFLEVPARPQALCWVERGTDGGSGVQLLAGCGGELVVWDVDGDLPSPVPSRRWAFGSPVTAIAVPTVAPGESPAPDVLVGLGCGALHAVALSS